MSTATKKELTLNDLRAKWIGTAIYSSRDHQLGGQMPAAVITDIHLNADDGKYYAWSGEHHSANTLESLDRRLHQLAGK